MRRLTRFDPDDTLIVVPVKVMGPAGSRKFRLAFDTGATFTTLQPRVADALGYDASYSKGETWVSTPIGRERGYFVDVAHFEALHDSNAKFRVNVLELADDTIDGLLGLNYLARFHYEVRSDEGRILSERIRA